MQPAPACPALDRVVADFRADGCACLGPVLTAAEVAVWRERFARDRQRYGVCWRIAGPDITNNVDILATMPEIDALIRHPRILAALRALLGAEPLFWETSARHLPGLGGSTHPDGWHRDFGGRATAVQAMFLLTDVTPRTHCLKLVPRALSAPVGSFEQESAARGQCECHGPAGSVWLVDPNCWHSACQRGEAERVSLHTYYCTAEHLALPEPASPHSIVPAALWRDGDAAARAFYALAPQGLRTALMAKAYAG
jgi:ectoine hydroxylase-related dioxygenase (phytanoyl-CoA dioxygenase family)